MSNLRYQICSVLLKELVNSIFWRKRNNIYTSDWYAAEQKFKQYFWVSEIVSSHRDFGVIFVCFQRWRNARYYTRERGKQRIERKSNSWIRASGDHESTGSRAISSVNKTRVNVRLNSAVLRIHSPVHSLFELIKFRNSQNLLFYYLIIISCFIRKL